MANMMAVTETQIFRENLRRLELQRNELRRAMEEFFRSKLHPTQENFIFAFMCCCDLTFKREIFQEAIKKCVELDCADCFAALCKTQCAKINHVMTAEQQDDCIFAYTSAISGNKLNFINNLIEARVFGQGCGVDITELQVLLDVILENKGWDLLVDVFPVPRYPFAGGLHFHRAMSVVVAKCVLKLRTDQSTWPYIAPVLDRWFRDNDVDHDVLGCMKSEVDMACALSRLVPKALDNEVSGLREWCVTNGHFCLALFLAMVTKDWPLVDTMVSAQTGLNLNGLIRGTAFMAARDGAYSTGAKLLKHCPLTAENLVCCFCSLLGYEQLGQACEDQGLIDWACVLHCCYSEHQLELLRQCSNQHVINHVLVQACEHDNWALIRELKARCTHPRTLLRVLIKAIRHSKIELSEQLLSRFDPSQVRDGDCGEATLLAYAVACEPPLVKVDMVSLLISSGLSTFQRDLPPEPETICHGICCPTLWALNSYHLPTVELMLDCGVYSHKRLHRIRENDDLKRCIEVGRRLDPDWKQGYFCMVEAAATPPRLQNLARLFVSHRIGCQPGRSQRIDALSLPKPLKNKLNFKDVLVPYSFTKDA